MLHPHPAEVAVAASHQFASAVSAIRTWAAALSSAMVSRSVLVAPDLETLREEALETKVPEAAAAIMAADESGALRLRTVLTTGDELRLASKLEAPGTLSALPHRECKLFVR